MKKQEKETQVLLGLVDLFIKHGKPIGSNTLKEQGFDHLSSATIRNYFLKLEEQGFLSQQHSSGGRLPTDLAYKFYLSKESSKDHLSKSQKKEIEQALSFEGKEIITYFNQVIDLIAEETGCATLLSSPRFDQDFITDIRLLSIDTTRILCILMTSFGLVETQIFYIPNKMSNFSIKRIEAYLAYKRTGSGKPHLDIEEVEIGDHIHHELLLRHIVGHATFTKEDIYKTGFTKLLGYPELQDTGALANTLSLFENPYLIHKLCEETCKEGHLKTWIGKDLEFYHTGCRDCSMMMIPYLIHDKKVGAIGVLGPTRIPYKYIEQILIETSKALSQNLSSLLFKHKMSYRMPQTKGVDFKQNTQQEEVSSHLLIDATTRNKDS